MFKYLVILAAAFYATLLIGGEDRGQQRMGLQGAYDTSPAPAPVIAKAPEIAPAQTAAAETVAPADSLRILPRPTDSAATLQPATLTPEAPPADDLRVITAEAANVRDGASRNAAVIGRLENGEVVRILETTGDWVHIRIEGDGIDGYVHRRLISTEPPGLTTTTLFPAVD